jgi:Ca-activated chloride channel family protein
MVYTISLGWLILQSKETFLLRKVFDVILTISLGFFSAASVRAQGERPRRVEPSSSSPASVPRTATASQTPQEVGAGDVVRVDTSLVTVPVAVLDRQGRFVYDLGKEDFRIFENGVEQEIAYFATVEEPFTVVLMLDTSSSVWKKLDQIKEAAISFVGQLRPMDRVMVVSFAHRMTVHCEPTNDRVRLRQTIRGIGKGMSTHLYDALGKVMTKKVREIKGRKAVVLFTDGVDESGDKTAKETLRYAEELDALIYTIRFDTYDERMDALMQVNRSIAGLPSIFGRMPLPAPPASTGRNGETLRDMYERGRRYLQELSGVTAGRYFEAGRDLHDLDQSFAQIAEELRRQYSLYYYPKTQGTGRERRHLRVRVSRADVAVRARDSYIYAPAATAKDDKTAASQE